MEDSKLIVVDDQGNELEMEILFTFADDQKNKNYVVYFDPKEANEEYTLYASIYDEEGHLTPIEADEEWKMIEEVIETFMSEQEDSESEEVEVKELAQ